MDDYERRVEENERWSKMAEESRRSGAEIQRRAITVGVLLGAVAFVYAGVQAAAVLFVCGSVAAGWVAVESSSKRPPK